LCKCTGSLYKLSWKQSTILTTGNAVFCTFHSMLCGTAVAQWLRCCATNRKVAGSIPGCVSRFFIDIKFFRSHYGPRVDSASNRNEYQEHFLGGKGVRLTTYHHPVPLSRNLGTLTSWKPLGHSRPLMGLLCLFTIQCVIIKISTVLTDN